MCNYHRQNLLESAFFTVLLISLLQIRSHKLDRIANIANIFRVFRYVFAAGNSAWLEFSWTYQNYIFWDVASCNLVDEYTHFW